MAQRGIFDVFAFCAERAVKGCQQGIVKPQLTVNFRQI